MSSSVAKPAASGAAEPSPAAPDTRSPALRSMRVGDVDAVMRVEAAVYPFPWTRGNFIDSLAAGYPAWVLEDAAGDLLGYQLAMHGVDELHLLNITVAPRAQGHGHARTLLEALFAFGREQRAAKLWLEVRAGNAHARSLYEHFGFAAIGRRKGYYPAPFGRREDAIVMTRALEGGVADAMG